MENNLDDFEDVEAFEMFDKDSDGYINMKELGSALRALRLEPLEEDLKFWVEKYGIKNDSNDEDEDEDDDEVERFVSYKYFCLIKEEATDNEAFDENHLLDSFKVFDKEGNGNISSTEFKHIMLTMGEKLPLDEVNEMIKEGDPNNEGVINYAKFTSVILSNFRSKINCNFQKFNIYENS